MRKPPANKELDNNSAELPAEIETPDDKAPETTKSSAKAGARVVERYSKTVTSVAPAKSKAARASNSDDDEDDDEDEDYDDVPDPLAFLRTSLGENDYPVTMSIFGVADKAGKIFSKDEILVYGQYDVDPETYLRDIKRIVPLGGYLRIDFRWGSIGGPDGQKPGSIAAREKMNLMPTPIDTAPVTGQTNGHAAHVDPNELKRQIRAEMREEAKFYKEMAGGGSGGGSLTETINLLNTLGLIRKPDEGTGLSRIKEVLEIKELLGGGDGVNGWTIARDIVGDLTESFGPVAAEMIKGRMSDISNNRAGQTAPAYDAETQPIKETIPEAIPVQLSPEQSKAFDELRKIAIRDYLANSPIDATALKAGEYVQLNAQHAMEIIAFLMANPIKWLSQQVSDPAMQQQILTAPHGTKWFQALNNKILTMR